MTDRLSVDEILRKVSAGELTPEQALPLLDAAGTSAGAPSASSPSAGDSSPSNSATSSAPLSEPASGGPSDDDPMPWGSPDSLSTQGTTSVRVHASYRSVSVIGDPTVAQVAVTGQHTVRRDGSVLVVESQDSPFSGFGEGGERGGFSFADLPRGVAWAKSWAEQRVVVRVNPELPVELDAAGASVQISGLEGGARIRLVASALKVERLRGPLDLDAMTSSVKGTTAPTGTSRITSESSSVKLLLGAGSDVAIKASNRMGKVVLPSGVSKGGLVDPDLAEARVGPGNGTLTVDAVMSSVVLTA